MKRILVVINNLNVGGIQDSCFNFVTSLRKYYHVDLVVFSNRIDKKYQDVIANVIPSKQKFFLLGIDAKSLKNDPINFFKKGWFVLLAKLMGGVFAHKLFFWNYHLEGTYDLAISFSQDINGRTFSVGCNDFVNFCVKSKQKATFIHCDFKQYGGNDRINRRRYHFFNNIFCVSQSCKRAFLDCCPFCEDKTEVIKNIINTDFVLKMSKCPIISPFRKDGPKFLFVGRISPEKGVDRMIRQFSYCHQKKPNSELCIIGDGPQKKEIETLTKSLGCSDAVIFLGIQQNPYPFFSFSDALLLFSYHECAPMVFDEAAILGLPIISSNTLSAKEMLFPKKRGLLIENFKEDSLSAAIDEIQKKKKNKTDIMDIASRLDDALQILTKITNGR